MAGIILSAMLFVLGVCGVGGSQRVGNDWASILIVLGVSKERIFSPLISACRQPTFTLLSICSVFSTLVR